MVGQTDGEAAGGEAGGRGRLRLRDVSRSLPMALLRCREAVMRHFRLELRAVDLTEQQWRVLRALGAVPNIDATGLASATLLLAPSLTRILRDLEERQLIRRRSDPDDLRTSLISLTPQGRAVLDEAGLRSERIYRALVVRLGEARLASLMQLLKEVERDLAEPLVPIDAPLVGRTEASEMPGDIVVSAEEPSEAAAPARRRGARRKTRTQD
jgi:homoprotocatechuate degradation regulator HpaR